MAGGSFASRKGSVTLKQAQMKLRQDEKELRQMTNATQLPIIVFSAEGRLLYANRFSLTYGGLSLEDVQRDGWREPPSG